VNVKVQISNQAQNPNVKKKYDLEKKVARFGEKIIEFAKSIPQNAINNSHLFLYSSDKEQTMNFGI